jgi:ribokinase
VRVRVKRDPVLAVLGAINIDLVVSGAPLPVAGQTVTGGTFAQHQGGKGGNQAVAAARALGPTGGTVWMLGAVGEDQLGVAALEALHRDAVQTDRVLVAPNIGTGVALIAVGPDGENQISVASGANGALEPAHVVEALDQLNPHVVLVSLEVPERVARTALEWSRDRGIPTVMNPAPPQGWARDLLAFATYVTPNEHERKALGEIRPGIVVVETRGAEGAVIDRDDGRTHVPAPSVDVVDTTGAGDCFNGVLAARLAEGHTLEEAVADAVVAASISVSVAGAREGMPTSVQIQAERDRP